MGHLGAGMAELLLDMPLVDLGRGGATDAKGVAREEGRAVRFWQIAPEARGLCGTRDESRDLAVI